MWKSVQLVADSEGFLSTYCRGVIRLTLKCLEESMQFTGKCNSDSIVNFTIIY